MKNFTLYKKLSFYSMSLFLVMVAISSCSSSQQAYNDGDGIYGSVDPKQEVVMVRDTRTDYYQNYFSGERENNEEYFTDIDAYQGNYDTDTVYVEDQYVGNPPWERTASSVSISFNVGIGAGWWGGGCYGWGGYYGWGYPCYGYGYGWGWGYPRWGWGWGPGWGYYPPYYPGYYPGYYERATYGKRYATNTGRFNTGRINRTDAYNSRSGRGIASTYSRSRTGRYNSSINNGRSSYSRRSSYSNSRSRSNTGYSRGNSSSRGYNSSGRSSRSYSPSSRGGSSGMRSSGGMRSGGGMRSSGGMRGSSGRRQMSYNDIEANSATNRTFIKRSQDYGKTKSAARVSYANARSNGNMQRYEKYVPSSRTRSGYTATRSSSGRNNAASSNRSGSRSSGSSAKSSSARSTGSVSRSSGSSRSSGRSSVSSSRSSSSTPSSRK